MKAEEANLLKERKLNLSETYYISAEAIERLQLVKPSLELDVRSPTLSNMPPRPPWEEAPHARPTRQVY